MDRIAIELPIDVDGERRRSETLQASLSPYVLTIGTTLPELGISLYSTYHGHPGAATLAVHLTRAPGRPPETKSREHTEAILPVVFGRARCLRDHAMELQGLLAELRAHAAIHLSDEAEMAVEAARTSAPSA